MEKVTYNVSVRIVVVIVLAVCCIVFWTHNIQSDISLISYRVPK